MQARGEVKKGVNTPDECIPAKEYISALAERGVKLREL
jgi:hypothetical protein